MFAGGLRPHMYCLPTAKRERHRLALRAAATSGNPKFFLGTDSAPHTTAAKESDCGCAGIFNAPFAIEAYAKVFAEEGALDRLESFASEFGPAFYRLPMNSDSIVLEHAPVEVPASLPAGNQTLRPFHARRDPALAVCRRGMSAARLIAGRCGRHRGSSRRTETRCGGRYAHRNSLRAGRGCS